MNKTEQSYIKVCRYSGASSTDINGHLTPSLKKAPKKKIIHAGTNNVTNNVNYLSNVTQNVFHSDTLFL